MANLVFERTHALDIADARQAARRVADEMTRKYDMRCAWEGDVLRFERSGVRGTMTVQSDCIQLDARLGALLSAFRPRIQAQLEQNFAQYFG